MFSGIVEKLGSILEFNDNILTIQEKTLSKELNISESIAINGICLTVIHKNNDTFSVEVTPETIKRTNLNTLLENELVNLEKPLKYNGLVGGHLVQGHVDCVGEIIKQEININAKIVTISIPETLSKYVVEKGYISVDGISLTIVECASNYFSISIIPFTLENTNLKNKTIGQNVNLEFDITGKYIEKLLDTKK
ncbi:MAG: riboflavin synthase [Dehalococcoidia bacterium]